MTLEQYAYLGEIAAAVGVMVSLAYVARQLGQNTAMMRIAAASERVERDFHLVDPLILSREFAEVWHKGGSEFASLDEVDRDRLIYHYRRGFVVWHQLFDLREQSLLPEADWREHLWTMRSVGRRQAAREAWGAFEESYEPRFRELVSQQFALSDDAAAPR